MFIRSENEAVLWLVGGGFAVLLTALALLAVLLSTG
jgi:hypothetical protein